MQDNENLPPEGPSSEAASGSVRGLRPGARTGGQAPGKNPARALAARRAAVKTGPGVGASGNARTGNKTGMKTGMKTGRAGTGGGPGTRKSPAPRRITPELQDRAAAIVAELHAADAEGRAPDLPPELLPGAVPQPEPHSPEPHSDGPAGAAPTPADPAARPAEYAAEQAADGTGHDAEAAESPIPGGPISADQAPDRHPPVRAAMLRLRHHVLMLSFLLVVVMPFVLTVGYLFLIAEDQYASTVGFTVRREEGATSSTELIGGLAQFAGTGGSSESDILYEYIQSQEIVAKVDERLGLGQLYSRHWPGDPLMALWPDPTIEDLLWYWGRMVRISYDQSTQLIELRVLAFSPDDTQRIASEIVLASQSMINALNTQSRNDMMRYANEDLETALARLKSAREALSRFRTRTQIVDPAADMQGRMGVLNTLQQQLAAALIDNDIVLETTQTGDPRREQAARRIQVIRDRIAAERQSFASDTANTMVGETYPALMAEFESLTVDLQFAEETYRAALAAVDVARAKASRQSLYLAPYIAPTLPQTAEFPQRGLIAGVIGLFLLLLWSIAALIYYSVRDRR